MNDRLAELLNENDVSGDVNRDIEMGCEEKTMKSKRKKKNKSQNDKDLELGFEEQQNHACGDEKPSRQKHMAQFFRDVESLESDISAIRAAADKIVGLKDDAILASSEAEEVRIHNRIQKTISRTNETAKQCKTMLDLLKVENSHMEKDSTVEESDLRIRKNLTNMLLHKFLDGVKQYNKAQEDYKTDVKRKVTRQIQIIKPGATESEVDDIMRSDGGWEALYQQCILSGGVNDEILTQYQQVEGKYNAILKLEASLTELQQMFLDVALLVEQQGEFLDTTEEKLNETNVHIEKGNENLYAAIQYQKQIRKRRCYILLIVLVVSFLFLFSMRIIP